MSRCEPGERVLLQALNLYVPATSEKEAHQLHRLRRHVAKCWAQHVATKGNWTAQLLHRYWSFFGHICQQEFHASHPAKVMLHRLALRHGHGLARPGPWNTPHALLQRFWVAQRLDGDYLYLAQDREHWKDLSHNFLCWLAQHPPSTKLEMLPKSPWESKGSLLRQQASWLLTLVLTVHDDACGRLVQLAWLDTAHGFSIITQKDLHPEVMLKQQSSVSCLLKLQSLCNTNPSCYSLPLVKPLFGTVCSLILQNTITFFVTDGFLGTKCFLSALQMLVLLYCNHTSILQHGIIYL